MPEKEPLIRPYDKVTYAPSKNLEQALKQFEKVPKDELRVAIGEWIKELNSFIKSINRGSGQERLRLSIIANFHLVKLQTLYSVLQKICDAKDAETRQQFEKKYQEELSRYITSFSEAFQNRIEVVDIDPRVKNQADREDRAFQG